MYGSSAGQSGKGDTFAKPVPASAAHSSLLLTSTTPRTSSSQPASTPAAACAGCNEIFMQSQRVLATEPAGDAKLMPRSRPVSGL